MNTEKLEHVVTERVVSISPDIASAEVILTSPITLPDKMEGEAYVGLVVIGAGKVIPGASVQTTTVSSFTGDIHEKTIVSTFFAMVLKEEIHVYLENQRILDLLRR